MDPILERARTSVEEAIARASADAMRRTVQERWSAAGVVEHLALSYAGTRYAMRKAIEKGRPIGHRPTLFQRLSQLVVIRIGYFPRVEAPSATRPSGLSPADALAAWRTQIGEMDEAIAACERAYGVDASLADHPVLGGLTAAGWRRFHLQHARHHARQIRARLAA